MLRMLVGVCLVVAVVFVVAAIDFGLDAVQLRHSVPATPPAARWSFEVGAAKALFKVLAAAITLIWFGLATRRALRASAPSTRTPTPPLVARSAERGQ
jgi:hypothetical protein